MEETARIPQADKFEIASGIFRQLESPTRLRIFWYLCHNGKSVAGIAAAAGMSSPAVSHHLRALKDCGLIVSARSGREMIYSAAHTPTAQALHLIVEQVMQIACPDE